MFAGGGADAEDARPELGQVHVDLEDAALGPHRLDQGGEDGLGRFAQPAAPLPQKGVLGGLLRQRRGPAAGPRGHDLADLVHVEAPVAAEIRILGGDDRPQHHGRDVAQVGPAPRGKLVLPCIGMHRPAVGRVDHRIDRDRSRQHQRRADQHEAQPEARTPGARGGACRIVGFLARGHWRMSHAGCGCVKNLPANGNGPRS